MHWREYTYVCSLMYLYIHSFNIMKSLQCALLSLSQFSPPGPILCSPISPTCFTDLHCSNALMLQMSYKIKTAMHYFCKPSCTPLAFHSIPTRCCCTVKDPRCFCKVSSLSHLLRCHRHYHHCAIIIIITSTSLLS